MIECNACALAIINHKIQAPNHLLDFESHSTQEKLTQHKPLQKDNSDAYIFYWKNFLAKIRSKTFFFKSYSSSSSQSNRDMKASCFALTHVPTNAWSWCPTQLMLSQKSHAKRLRDREEYFFLLQVSVL